MYRQFSTMPTTQTFITQLLRTYHGRESICTELSSPIGPGHVRYLCDVGLGPIAFRTYGEVLRESNAEIYSILLSADLTTRAIYKQMENATAELLEGLNCESITPTLLKGISTAYEFYSPSHLRLMGDVDVLVKRSEIAITMTKLADLGYIVADEDWVRYHEKGHHHLPGARNPKTGVTVEVHTSLFAPGGRFAEQPVFQTDNIRAQTVEFDYNGIRASRFTPEFQLVYTIGHWAVDGNWAVNLTSINDTIHILRRHQSDMNWSTLEGWIAGSPRIYPNIAALTSYLDQADIVAMSPRMREVLAHSKLELGRRTTKILIWLLHNYPFNAGEKTRDSYAMWRARAIWQELARPSGRDIKIPYSFARTVFRSFHHGKYNPFGWLLSLYRYLTSRLSSD